MAITVSLAPTDVWTVTPVQALIAMLDSHSENEFAQAAALLRALRDEGNEEAAQVLQEHEDELSARWTSGYRLALLCGVYTWKVTPRFCEHVGLSTEYAGWR